MHSGRLWRVRPPELQLTGSCSFSLGSDHLSKAWRPRRLTPSSSTLVVTARAFRWFFHLPSRSGRKNRVTDDGPLRGCFGCGRCAGWRTPRSLGLLSMVPTIRNSRFSVFCCMFFTSPFWAPPRWPRPKLMAVRCGFPATPQSTNDHVAEQRAQARLPPVPLALGMRQTCQLRVPAAVPLIAGQCGYFSSLPDAKGIHLRGVLCPVIALPC